jgi:hypothetical protein
MLFDAFSATNRYPHLILSGHVHNYQRFTDVVQDMQIPCVVAGAGGYTKLGTLHKINGQDPSTPLPLGGGLTLEQYDQTEFGFLRLEVSKTEIVGSYFAAPYTAGSNVPKPGMKDSFTINLAKHTVSTGGKKPKPPQPKPPQPKPPQPKPPQPPKRKR